MEVVVFGGESIIAYCEILQSWWRLDVIRMQVVFRWLGKLRRCTLSTKVKEVSSRDAQKSCNTGKWTGLRDRRDARSLGGNGEWLLGEDGRCSVAVAVWKDGAKNDRCR